MPGSLLRVARPAGERVREGDVRGATFGWGCRLVDRRADKRVPEHEAMSIDTDEACSLGGIHFREVEPQERECLRGRLYVLRVACGCDDERVPRSLAKRSGASCKQALDPGSDLNAVV